MYLNGIKTYFRLKRNLVKPLKELQAEQWLSVRELVSFAYRQVPFYRELYDNAGFMPESLRVPSDIQLVPKTDKTMFQKSDPDRLLAAGFDADKLIRKRTSGSTGSPLDVFYTPDDRIYRTILHLRILFYNGMTFRDKMAHISDSRDVPDYRYTFQKWGFLPKEFVYAADPCDQQLLLLAKINPAVIYGYASSMILLSSEIKKLGGCIFQPKLVFTTGELLNSDDRQLIDQAFRVQLRDIYGVVEMGDVAWQCPEINGYHHNIDSFLAEVMNGDNAAEPGETGKLCLTNLHSRAMPFIRYEVGDIVTAPQNDPCPCGCAFPRLDVLQGRADDWLYAIDGKKVSPLIFVVASIPGVQQYRMIQKTYDQLIVEILPGPEYSELTLKHVSDHVLEVMGPGINVEVVKVDSIPQQSGKMRRVISEINQKEK